MAANGTVEIHGHLCAVNVFKDHGAGTIDVEVLACATCPGLVGKCFRVSGLAVRS